MPTSEEVRDWLAHHLQDNELAHHGVLGMHWGQHKAEPPASGISSHATDHEAKHDAKEHAKAYINKEHEKVAQPVDVAARTRINRIVATKSAANPEYAKAFAYHQPRALRAEKVKAGITTGVLVGAAAAYTAWAVSPVFKKHLMNQALKVAAARGAKAAVPILKEIGPKPIAALALGADGVWRLAA